MPCISMPCISMPARVDWPSAGSASELPLHAAVKVKSRMPVNPGSLYMAHNDEHAVCQRPARARLVRSATFVSRMNVRAQAQAQARIARGHGERLSILDPAGQAAVIPAAAAALRSAIVRAGPLPRVAG